MIQPKLGDIWLVVLVFLDFHRCYPSVLTFLIKHGALLNEKDKKDFTPLQLSTFYGCKICIGILIENGCDTSIQVTRLNLSLSRKILLLPSQSLLKCCISTQDSVGDTALNNAIIIDTKEGLYRDHEILYQLISKSDLTIKNNKGYNSLLLAAITENRRYERDSCPFGMHLCKCGQIFHLLQ